MLAKHTRVISKINKYNDVKVRRTLTDMQAYDMQIS